MKFLNNMLNRPFSAVGQGLTAVNRGIIWGTFLILTACGTKNEQTDNYPVTTQYGWHYYSTFASENCQFLESRICDHEYVEFFGAKLIEFYQKPIDALKIIDLDENLVRNNQIFEDYIKQY